LEVLEHLAKLEDLERKKASKVPKNDSKNSKGDFFQKFQNPDFGFFKTLKINRL